MKGPRGEVVGGSWSAVRDGSGTSMGC
ncbi:hypothetical protein ID866_13277 [Astraeus odoratus]|nr:hypothetical protein ID866_13277 [Astraeus odoratus]